MNPHAVQVSAQRTLLGRLPIQERRGSHQDTYHRVKTRSYSRFHGHHSPLGLDRERACWCHRRRRRQNRTQRKPSSPRRSSHPAPGVCSPPESHGFSEKEKVKLERWTSVQNTHMFPVLCPSRSYGSEMNSWWKTYPGVYHCHLDTLANDSLVPQLVHLGHHVR